MNGNNDLKIDKGKHYLVKDNLMKLFHSVCSLNKIYSALVNIFITGSHNHFNERIVEYDLSSDTNDCASHGSVVAINLTVIGFVLTHVSHIWKHIFKMCIKCALFTYIG